MSDDPIRLRDDPAESAALRAMLEAAREERADDAMLENVLASVLRGGGGGGGSGGAPAAAKGSALVTLGGGAAVVALVAIVVGVGVLGNESPHVSPTDAGTSLEDAAIALADAGEASADAAVVVDAETHAAVIAPRHVPAHVEPVEARPPDPRLDLSLVRQATAALASDPAHALELANQHRSEFPDSVLAEEREADAILALVALHRDATERAAAFRARWPRSAHLRRVDEALAH
jgi:hypothetical protein